MVSPIQRRLISQLKAKGISDAGAKGISDKVLTRAGDLHGGHATAKGEHRGAMSPAERAKDRAATYSGHKSSEFGYNAANNTATLRRGRRGS